MKPVNMSMAQVRDISCIKFGEKAALIVTCHFSWNWEPMKSPFYTQYPVSGVVNKSNIILIKSPCVTPFKRSRYIIQKTAVRGNCSWLKIVAERKWSTRRLGFLKVEERESDRQRKNKKSKNIGMNIKKRCRWSLEKKNKEVEWSANENEREK